MKMQNNFILLICVPWSLEMKKKMKIRLFQNRNSLKHKHKPYSQHLFPGYTNETFDEHDFKIHTQNWEEIQGKPFKTNKTIQTH